MGAYRVWLRPAALAAVLAAGVLWVHFGGPAQYRDVRRLYEAVQEASARPWFPAAFVAMYVGAALAGFPASLLSVLGGILFGVFPGVLWAALGANVGAWAGYGIGRLLGDESRKKISERFPAVARLQSRDAVALVAEVRLLPLVPFMLSNLAFAVLGCPFLRFAAGTFLGLLPGSFIYAYVGQSWRAAGLKSDFSDPDLALSTALLAGLFVAAAAVHRFIFSRRAPGSAS